MPIAPPSSLNLVCRPLSDCTATSIVPDEPPYTEPYVRWCGRGKPRGFLLPDPVNLRSVEHRVDVVLRGVADIAVELRAVEQLVVALAGVDDRRRMRLDGVDAAPDVHHLVDVLLDELHRRHHLGDALAGEVLKIAGLEDRDDALLDFLAEQLLLFRGNVLRQRAGRLVDRLGGLQDL